MVTKDADIAAAIRETYPRHSKAAFSLAKRTKETGVMLCPGARDLMYEFLGKAKKDPRKVKYQMRARLPRELEERVKARITREHTTIQAVIVMLLTEWVEKENSV